MTSGSPTTSYYAGRSAQLELHRPSLPPAAVRGTSWIWTRFLRPCRRLRLDVDNFATASSWCCQQISRTVEPTDFTYDGRPRRGWMHKVYQTLVDCNTLTPLLRFVLDFLYNLFLHCCATVGKILTDTLRCAVRAALLVKFLCWRLVLPATSKI